MPKSREVHLVARPEGLPRVEDFEIVQTDVADAGDGEVLVQNLFMSVDPAMRPRLTAGYELEQPMAAAAIGRVVQSNSGELAAGDLVSNGSGFREYFVSGPHGLRRLAPVVKSYSRTSNCVPNRSCQR